MNKRFTHFFITKAKKHLGALAVVGLMFLIALPLQGQDVHFSQIHNVPMYANPGLTGIFRGDTRFAASYRSQWNTVPVAFSTFAASADMKFIRRTAKKGFFSGGLQFFYDQAGLTKLTLVNLGLMGSYTHQLSDQTFLTGGVMLGGSQRGFSLDGVLFDNQWNGDIVDATRPTGENFTRTNKFFMDMGAGINFRWQSYNSADLVDRLDKRSKLDAGLGIFHFNTPDQAFYEEDQADLPMRFSPYLMSTIQIDEEVDIIAHMIGQFQGQYTEWIGVLGGKLHLDRTLGSQWALQLQCGYRFDDYGDAIFPGVEVFYNNWQAGFTYDLNISDFNAATRRRGGPEISVRYTIRKVRPLPEHKICPLI
jgi:type IX secretion system PorP/SprF family membrane protein